MGRAARAVTVEQAAVVASAVTVVSAATVASAALVIPPSPGMVAMAVLVALVDYPVPAVMAVLVAPEAWVA